MKFTTLLCLALALIVSVGCQDKVSKTTPDTNKAVSNANMVSNQTVEASCGQCQFELEGGGCDLAIRIDGKSYYVDGANLDDHGDAHAKDGLCNCIRQAKVTGEVKDGRFVASSFEVLPADKPSSD